MESEASVRVPVHQVDSVENRVAEIREQLSARAYENFLQRGGEPGRELEDWLAAENEMFVKGIVLEPRIENNQVVVEIVLQDVDPEHLIVFVTPSEMLLLGVACATNRRIFEIVSFQREILPTQTEAEYVIDTVFVVAELRSDREIYEAA